MEDSQSLLAAVTYREIIDSQEAHLLAFANSDDQFETITIDRLNKAMHLSYLNLHVPNSHRSRYLTRLNSAQLSSE